MTLYPVILLNLPICTSRFFFVDFFGGGFYGDDRICEQCYFTLSNLSHLFVCIFIYVFIYFSGLIALPETSTMLKKMGGRVDILVLGLSFVLHLRVSLL